MRFILIEFVNSNTDEIYSLSGMDTDLLTRHIHQIEDTYSDRKALNTWFRIADSIKQNGHNPTWLSEYDKYNK